MFSIVALQKNLVTVCKDILQDNVTEVIIAEQAAPRPANPYVSLKVLGTHQVGSANWRASETDGGKFDLITDNEILVSFSAFGVTAQDIIFALCFHFTNNVAVMDTLSSFRMGIRENPTIVDRSLLLETKFEQRRMCTAKFIYTHVETVDYGVIEHITVNSEYKSDSGDIVETNTITVDKI